MQPPAPDRFTPETPTEISMSRPDSPHVTSLKAFRDRLVEARRAAAQEADTDAALKHFSEIQHAIDLVDHAMDDEMDLTPIPRIDDPTEAKPAI
jgi:hypothetical protein